MSGNLYELLGDRRCTGNDVTMLQTLEPGPARSEPVDPMVGIEAFVFGGEDCRNDVSGHIFQRQFAAEALCDASFPEGDAVPIQERDALHRWSQQRSRNRNEPQREFARD